MNYPRICEILSRKIGLEARTVGERFVDSMISKEMERNGFSAEEEYAHLLTVDSSALTALVESVLIPETWWFRDGEAFAYLAELCAEKRSARGRRFRVLSIPCSTGEEPYSAAIQLLESGVLETEFQIDAVDVGERALDAAQRGIFRRSTMRNLSAERLNRWFKSDGEMCTLRDSVIRCVRFRHANLLGEGDLPAGPFDAVFCRNLLIYFGAEARECAMSTLLSLLSEHGVLFSGPAESYYMIQCGLTPVARPHAFAFRRVPVGGATPVPPRASGPAARPKSFRTSQMSRPATRRPAPSRTVVAQPPAPVASSDELSRARDLANRGDLAEALRLCESVFREKGPGGEVCCLCGVIQHAMGANEAAENFYRMALYLAPENSEALWHMASLCRENNRAPEAALFEERARRADEKGHATVK